MYYKHTTFIYTIILWKKCTLIRKQFLSHAKCPLRGGHFACKQAASLSTNLVGGLGREREEKRKEKKESRNEVGRITPPQAFQKYREAKIGWKRTESHTSLRLRSQILRGYSLCFFAIFPLFQKSKTG
jgi:hypothetical protein